MLTNLGQILHFLYTELYLKNIVPETVKTSSTGCGPCSDMLRRVVSNPDGMCKGNPQQDGSHPKTGSSGINLVYGLRTHLAPIYFHTTCMRTLLAHSDS